MMLHLIHDKKEGEKVPTEKIEVNRTEKPHVHRTQKIMRRRKKNHTYAKRATQNQFKSVDFER